MSEMIERIARKLWELEQDKDYVRYGFSNQIIWGKNPVKELLGMK